MDEGVTEGPQDAPPPNPPQISRGSTRGKGRPRGLGETGQPEGFDNKNGFYHSINYNFELIKRRLKSTSLS